MLTTTAHMRVGLAQPLQVMGEPATGQHHPAACLNTQFAVALPGQYPHHPPTVAQQLPRRGAGENRDAKVQRRAAKALPLVTWVPRRYRASSFRWVSRRLATYTNEVNERVTLKKCLRSAFDELNIMPMKVMVFSGGRRRAMSGPRPRMS